MFTAAGDRTPKKQKAGSGMPTSHNFIHNSDVEDSLALGRAQRLMIVPRIIATHWLQLDTSEAANG